VPGCVPRSCAGARSDRVAPDLNAPLRKSHSPPASQIEAGEGDALVTRFLMLHFTLRAILPGTRSQPQPRHAPNGGVSF